MPGLFIQRQAEALTPFCDVAVIYVHPDPDCPNSYEVDFSEENQVRVLRVYFRTVNMRYPFFGRILNLFRFYRANMKAIRSIRQFSPEIVHAHVLTRMGFIGWRISWKNKIPLVISEHWSRYFPENNAYQKGLHHWITKFLVKKSSALILVSATLKFAMEELGIHHPKTFVIPNVVDLDNFSSRADILHEKRKSIIHVSCFEEKSKNIAQFLRTLHSLSLTRQDFICILVGEGPDHTKLQEYADELGIKDTFVNFTGLKTGPELAELMHNADFLVLSSRYETFATVVVEALAYGIPVVATRVGIVPEVINESNGRIVPPGDEQAMTLAIDRMLDECREYDRERIKASVEQKFTKEVIGKQIVDIYKGILSHNH
jgi:glycosyltransferase involved in cell wall biosynthesis